MRMLLPLLFSLASLAAEPARLAPGPDLPFVAADAKPPGVHALAWSSDSSTLAVGVHSGAVALWDVKARKPLRVLRHHQDSVLALAFSPDGARLASGGRDRAAALWDVKGGKLLRVLPRFDGWATCVAFAPDGRTLATGCAAGPGPVRTWNVADGNPVSTLPTKLASPWLVAFQGEGGELLAAGTHPTGGPWESWNLGARLPVVAAFEPASASSFAVSADGLTLVTLSKLSREALVWELAAGRVRARLDLEDEGQEAALSRDGRLLAVAGRDGVALWDLASARLAARFPEPKRRVYALAFAPDGKTLAVGHEDSSTLLRDVAGAAPPLPARSLKPAELDKLADALLDPDLERAWRATWRLAAEPAAADLLRQRLAKATVVDVRTIAGRVADLDDDRFRVRQAAEEQLGRWGLDAVPVLEHVLTQEPSCEVRERVRRILPLARRVGINPERLLVSRGVEALGRMTAPEGRQALAALAKGPPDAAATRAARAALASRP